jgi:hypothetical protein
MQSGPNGESLVTPTKPSVEHAAYGESGFRSRIRRRRTLVPRESERVHSEKKYSLKVVLNCAAEVTRGARLTDLEQPERSPTVGASRMAPAERPALNQDRVDAGKCKCTDLSR